MGIIFFFFTLLSLSLPITAQEQVPIAMDADWLRRDWNQCRENVSTTYKNGIFTVHSDHAAALFWQVPTRDGSPLPIDRKQDWIERCDRPPRDFENQIKQHPAAEDRLIALSEYPYISWRWRISNTIDDRNTINRRGEIQQEGDDFAAKIGISILNEKNELREIAYVWARSIPEETALTQVTTVIPWVLRYRWYRIVAESGDKKVNTWVRKTRNLYEDFKRFYPNEEPKEIVRIYLMSDSDNTGGAVTGAYADLIFHKNPPLGYVKTDAPNGKIVE